jgi:membrane fusion protein, multidrug efflux system
MKRRWIGSLLLIVAVVSVGVGLAAWKYASIQKSYAASANQPEPMESVTVAVVKEVEHRLTATSIGTVLALRSITVRNELPGTVRQVRLTPGQVVDAGMVLVALDVSVEEAELKAQEAQAALSTTVLNRRQNLSQDQATTQEEVDRARADRDIALAQIARTKAIIARKTIRAPFRARVGMADLHPGQYLNEGAELTTLQGIDDAVHVDFTVAQQVAADLRKGDSVEVSVAGQSSPIAATIVAVDARIGSSVRVRVPIGLSRKAVAIPVSAMRKGPGGDQVFVIEPDKEGKTRAHVRQVESGAMVGDEVMIHAGLSAGSLVAASGSFKLRDGVLVATAGEPKNENQLNQVLSQH